VETNIAIPGDEAARITAVSEDVGFVVVAGDADVVGPCYFDKLGMLECPSGTLDEWRRHVFVSPAEFGLLGQRKDRRVVILRPIERILETI
jgi:hypothetical protein